MLSLGSKDNDDENDNDTSCITLTILFRTVDLEFPENWPITIN